MGTETKTEPSSLEDLLSGDPAELTKPIKAVEDKWNLVPAFLKVRGLVKQQIDSFNYLIQEDMYNIVMADGNRMLTCDADPEWYMRYLDVRVGSPTTQVNYVERRLTPHDCRLRDMTYSAPIHVDIEYTVGRQVRRRRDVFIGRMPIMLRSSRCVLHGAPDSELIACNECPLDPGGYFVIRGTEKVILIQEQLSKNRILVETDSDGDVMASVTSTDAERKTMTKLRHKRGVFQLQHNIFEKPVNLALVFKALGVESDQELCQLVGASERFSQLLLATFHDATQHSVYTQRDALVHLMKRSRKEKMRAADVRRVTRDPADEALEMLSQLVVSHVPTERYNLWPKVVYLALMLRRMLCAVIDPTHLDDRDYYGNKRLELAGGQLSLLFEDLFKKMNSDLLMEARKTLAKASRTTAFDAVQHVRSDIITHAMEAALSTGCWNIKRFKMDRKGATQVLSRLSFIGAIGMMTRIMSQFEKTRKVSGPRALQPSQWGLVCPCDTPEGESCGLVKNLALMTHVTTDDNQEPFAQFAYMLGVQPMSGVHPGSSAHTPGAALVLLNGAVLGVHTQPHAFVDGFRLARRHGLLSEFASIVFMTDTIQISVDGGRLCRPLVICRNGRPCLTQDHVHRVKAGKLQFMELVAQGVVEFLDTNEENNTLIAMDEAACTRATTHMEIEPFTILGVVAGLIPFPTTTSPPATRTSVQWASSPAERPLACAQAMGTMACNQHLRLDTLLYLLVSPMRPLLTTRTIEMVGFDQMGAGQNATVCVMSYSGYDIEDAIIMNKASLDRGFGRCIVHHTYKATLKKYSNRAADRVMAPVPKARVGTYHLLESDGLSAVGRVINPGDSYVCKQVPSNTRDAVGEALLRDDFYRPQESRYKGVAGEKPVIGKVMLSSNDDSFLLVKTQVRHVRRPELGDKFSSRHGQKGVVGLIVAQEDFPFSTAGICPDLIMNPHGFPSRMTVGKMIECLGSKAAVLSGRFHYGGAFGEDAGLAHRVSDICEELVNHGYSYSGKDLMTSGITGEPLEAHVFMGPIYYQKLKHMVLDKVHARSRGPRVTLTRQPTEGRSRDGGLRLGEMERDCLVAYGASNLLLERLMISSDLFTAYVDGRSGLLGWYDVQKKQAVSPVDKTSEHMAAVKMPYACKLLFQELQAMNIVPRITLKDL
eukprot:jgi/Ulvmu1/10391/UM061_0075.1